MKERQSFSLTTHSSDETMRVAIQLSEQLAPGSVLLLEGDLGAGKTTFTKGLAKGLGIERNVNSPTFTIIKEYRNGRLPLYHMDVYRVEDEFEDLGFDEYFNGDGVTVVEWAHLIKEQLPEERLEINIFHQAENERKIEIEAVGSLYIDICKELFNS
ncbi:tRNA (adenosine(37)-N6)-threonylcarbamoyltransferase complex ATPase subunit type 1 TsaE [Priestia koreensis]|uniref:tRNA (adenosine(37)-N6)-threonylcarbamoyltransferase complex ATPase subunit type 1 TsaE n=1 Tax=Priestia koreensis TaxID=284581 RepID=UPI00203A5EAA|nr:tRNA (adenosine(37)-N6)-threonylcarbamoyltransferase complex ATPase subunit type 1 TsaE [Priestia koreensis]MCM3007087.1 tRNA (adenosine(37)-N6)-threonylcarbamoyltransferase complex ATPase subunit type 1 TsaE [Priestia koreensis]